MKNLVLVLGVGAVVLFGLLLGGSPGSSGAAANDLDAASGQLVGTVETTSGAPPVAIVDLFDAAGDGSRSSYTGSVQVGRDGRYGFTVEAGCYVVVVVAPQGSNFTSGSRWDEQAVCLDGADAVLTPAVIDDEDRPPADEPIALGGFVDRVGGGVVPGVDADLFGAAGDGSRTTYLGSTQTDADGRYQFLPTSGCFVVVLIAPSDSEFEATGRYQEHRACGSSGASIDDLNGRLAAAPNGPPAPTPPSPSPSPDDPPAPAPPPADPSPDHSIGFSPGGWFADEPDAELLADLDRMVEVGATWIRVDFDWSEIESNRGDYHWHRTDRIVEAANARGLKVLGLITEAPAWARAPETTSKSPPSDPAHYASFAAAAVDRYRARGVDAWELWNEPNLGMFWGPHPDPLAYVDLVRPAVQAMRAVDPGLVVISGGLAPAADRPDRTSVAPMTFVAAMLDAGGGDLFDGIGMHPFSYPARPIDPDSAAWNPFHNLPVLRQLIVDSGYGHLELWLTEYGAPTGSSDRAVSEDEQAAQLTEAVTIAQSWPWTGPIFLYSIRDERDAPGDFQANFGLFTNDGTPKQSWWALLALA